MDRKRIGKGYSIVIILMIILSPLTSIYLWDGLKSAAAENPLTPVTTITGLDNDDNFGWNVSWIGDVNGDGYDDIIVGAPYIDRYSGGGDWWDNAWSYRRKLTFDNSGQSEDMENFPTLVNLSSSNFDYSKAKLDGTDLRFIDADNVTELKYHIEDWNSSGYSYIWVNVTNIDGASSIDHIWMYYGNSAALDIQDVSGTYDTNFLAVWHLNETGTGTRYDSTSNDYDGTPQNYDGDEATTGKIDGADNFNQNHDIINVSTMNPQSYDNFTIEAWYKSNMDSGTDDGYMFDHGIDESVNPEIEMGFSDDAGHEDRLVLKILDNGVNSNRYYGTSDIVDQQFHHLVVVRDDGRIKLYVDGVLENDEADDDAGETISIDTTMGPYIGDFVSTSEFINGILDEVRVSDKSRSADWVKAQYLSLNNSFITYTGEESLSEDRGAAYIFFGYPGIILNNINATNANVTIYGSNAGDLFGWSVAAAGDVNNDDYDDIIIGAPGWGADKGRTYIFHGRAPSSWSAAYDADTDANMILTGENDGDKFGFSVSGAGDMNNDDPTGDFYEDWSYRKKITINSLKVIADLIDFPVLISFIDSDLKSKARSDGYDIIFTDSDGKTKLDHEIESYNSSSGELVAWVNIPFLSSSTDTIIYVYYGNNDQSTSMENPERVWDSNYMAVHHLADSPTGTVYDSTSNDIDVTSQGSMTADNLTDGQIGKGIEFDGVDDGLQSTNSATINQFTMGVWYYQYTNTTYWKTFVAVTTSRQWAVKDQVPTFWTDTENSFGSEISTGCWHYVVLTFNGSDYTCYLNGSQYGDTILDSLTEVTDPIEIGFWKPIEPQSFHGILDEVRISNIARSADWIATEFNNQNDTGKFYNLGEEEIITLSWLYRKPITINSSRVTEDLTDFPVVVSIIDSDIQNKARSDGFDIVFTEADGKTKLDHEIESYNSSSGELVAWVRIPLISSVTDTVIYMYYGNSNASDQQNIEGAWSDNYRGVWHLAETSGFALDSTSYGLEGTLSGTITRGVAGPIGNAYQFDGTDGIVNMGNPADGHLDFGTGNFTVSVWVNVTQYADYQYFVYKGGGSDGNNGYTIYYRETGQPACVAVCDGTNPRVQDNFDTVENEQAYLVLVADRSTNELYAYLNGVLQPDINSISSLGDINDSSALRFSRAASEVNGIIDEVRISSVARSAAWIQAEYNNTNDTSTFYTLGNEESNINYDDVIVGAYSYAGESGRVYVFFGGSGFTGEISAGNADVIINGTSINDRLGWDVSRAGDVNNDGFGDVIIGAPGNNSNAGAAYIFYGNNPMPSFIDANDADRIMIGSGGEEFGFSVSNVMDVNNDGYDDVIIGAPGYNFDQGRAYIFCNYGLNDIVIANVDDDTVSIYNGTSNGWEAESNLGVGVDPRCVFINDANNDGYNDIVTADWGDETLSIFNGTSNGGWESRYTLSAPGSPWVVVVGDVNNDGLNDIVVNDYDHDKVTIYNGTSSGLWDPIFQLNVGDYPRCVTIGDANNDGYNDILTVDQLDNTVTIYNGTSGGDWDPKINLSIGNYPRWVCVGDANNDGYNDVVTANSNDDSVTIYNGTTSGNWESICTLIVGNDPRCVFIGDANNDGYNDILASNYADDTVTIYNGTNNNGWEVKGTLGVGNGPMSVFIGDANNDGYNDILTVDYWGDNTVTIYNGTSDGFWETKYTLSTGASPHSIFVGNANNDGMEGFIDANNANLILTGVSTGDKFGFSVGSAGDLNEDGFHDIIVGAPFYDDGAKIDAGAIYVFEGCPSMNNTIDWSYKGEYGNDHLGWSVSFARNVNGDGLTYLIAGAPNNDDGGIDAGKVYLLTIMPTKPVITNILATPSIQNIDGYVNFSCDVAAVCGVDEVWINITLPDGGFTNVSMTQGIGNQWYYNNNYTIPSIYQYTIWANDTLGNWTESGIFFFEVINSLPSLSSPQVNPTVGYTDTGFNFSVIYTDLDNHAPNNITVNITGIGFYDLTELDPSDTDYTNGKGYYYNVSGFAVGSYSFHFAANDTIGEWTDTGILLFDVLESSPMISLEQVNPTTGNTDTGFNFTVTYTHSDNQPPYNITVNITGIGIYDLIEVDPLDTDYSDGKDYYYNASGFSVGQHSFHFAANDTNGNWNESSILMFEVLNRVPILSFEQVIPVTGYIDTWFNFTVIYSDLDNHAPVNISVNITGVGIFNLIEIDPLDIDFSDGKAYYYNTSGLAIGSYNFHFAANDTFGDWIETGILQFDVVDRIPVLISGQVNPSIGDIETAFNFTVIYTDLDNNAPDMITVNITGIGVYDLIELDPSDTTYTDGKAYYYNVSGLAIGSYNFHFAANDTFGNWIESVTWQFDVVNRVPILTSGQVNPTVGDIDTSYNFSVIYTDLDNHPPDIITVNITGIGIYDLIALDPLDMDYTDGKVYYYNTSGFSINSYSFNFAANDTQGDWVETIIMNFDVIDRVPTLLFGQVDPTPGYTDTWFNYTVTYVDLDNHAPDIITVNITGVGVYSLYALDPLDMDYTDGKIYYNNLSGFAVGSYSFHFAANDTFGNWIVTGTLPFDVINRAPTLSFGQVDPTIGYTDTWFNFTVNYTDLDNHAPFNIKLNLSGPSGGIFDLLEVDPTDSDYTDSKEYFFNTTLTSGLYSFHFAANDSLGLWAIETIEIDAPDVVPKHGTLGVVDCIEEFSDDIHLNATMLDDYNNPIPYENVAFYIDINKNGTYEAGEFAGIGSTSANGSVSVIYTSNLPVGTYYFNAVYVGSGDFVVDDGEALLTIVAKEATLTATSDIVDEGQDIYLTAVLIDNESDPIGNEQVAFYIDKNKNGFYEGGEFIGLTTTSPSGAVSVSYTVNLAPESYGILARYLGSSNYAVNEIEGLLLVRNIGNNPPMITGIVPNQIKPEDSLPWALDLTFYEEDVEDYGSDLKWYLTGVDTSLYSVTGMNSSDDVFTFIPVPDAFGNNEVTLWLEDSSGAKVSQVLWVNITPVNDPPYFDPSPPNLFVHYDDPSTDEDDPEPWDYTFYVHDIETRVEGLIITTSEPTVNTEYGYAEVDGLKVTFHYPQSMVGQSVLVFLTLSDGTDTAQAMILVNVTSDWVPELATKLPDVVIEENTTLYNVFDLDDYFIDRDEDSLYFSSGYHNIRVDINENNTVDITALEHWTGSELVTFRAEDPIGAIAEDTIMVTVIPVNDPPEISGVPDLVVHYDYSYAFDLSPYISDPDNLTSELIVWTSELWDYVWLQHNNNLGIVVNYPESMNGTTIPVTIYVSDGIEIASQQIQISVTNNFPPELISNLPDIFFDEDTILWNAFCLSDYFDDIDNQVLYYTNGTKFINATINENLTVDFSAPENWYGFEWVTFRATDPMGALAEDKILVVVVPVNDAPTIESIPRQEKEEGDQWILDLSQYIDDVDNNASELIITIRSEVGQDYVILVGTILMFQYPEGIRDDVISITVSDGELEASRSFIVDIKSSDQYMPTIWDLIPWPWVLLFIITGIGGAFAFYKKKSKYWVYEAFLIHEKGVPMAHVSQKESSDLEDVVVSGMFTAVQDFINDAFSGKTADEDWELDEMKFGDNKILIERSQRLFLAVIFEGNGGKLRNLVKKLLVNINKEYGAVLEDWDGDMTKLVGIRPMVAGLISKKTRKKLRSEHLYDQSQIGTQEEDIEGAMMRLEDPTKMAGKELEEYIERIKETLPENVGVLEVDAREIDVLDCPVCGKKIEAKINKCPRCGVQFTTIEDLLTFSSQKLEEGGGKITKNEGRNHED